MRDRFFQFRRWEACEVFRNGGNILLVLSRKVGRETIVTLPDGRRGRVVIVEIRGDKARVGFDFPDDVKVHRSEVQDAIDTTPPRPVPAR